MINLTKNLKELETEDFIWIIYSFIVIGAIISNEFEKKWLINRNRQAKKVFKTINITIFVVSFFIYAYFVILTYQRFKETKKDAKISNLFLNNANFIAACLFLIGGMIYLFTEIASNSELTEPPEEL